MQSRLAGTKAIFWDNDGVLVNSEHLYFSATRDALASVGIGLTREQYVEWFLVQGRGAFHLALASGMTEGEIATLRARRDAIFSELLAHDNLVLEGVPAVLGALSGRFEMGIVTSSERVHFDLIHSRTRLLDYFSFVVASGDYRRSKPHPDPYLKALERTGLQRDECIVIEDSVRGLTAARDAGLRCIVIPSEMTRGSDFAGAEIVLGGARELIGVLADLGQ
jgi:HAD superfamily hydrolase (TIGR01509 family)